MPSTLYITEFAGSAPVGGRAGSISPPMTPPLAEQHVQVSSSSVTSAPFNAKTTFVMVCSDVASCLAWGTAPTADPLSQRMAANETRFYGVPRGGNFVVAVILPT